MRKTLLAVSFFLSTTAWTAPYQKITAEIPSYLPPGVKDSVLIVWGPPIAELPNQTIDSGDSPIVWVKVRVGAKGRATDVSVVYSTIQDSAKIKAALKAAKLGLYYAMWDGPYAVEYEGYYPVTFYAFDYAEYSPNQPIRIYSATNALASGGKTLAGVGPYEQTDWKDIEIYVGRDAPVVAPLNGFEIKWPKKLSDSIAETTVWLKVQIRRDGSVASAYPFFFLGSTGGFDKAACEAVRTAKFPIKTSDNRSLPYDAYVAVPFVHPPEFFDRFQLPPPDDSIHARQLLRPVDDTVIEVLPGIYRAGISGTVRLRQLVSAAGTVLTSRLDSSSGFVEVDRLAEVRGLDMRYKPADRDEVESPQWTSVRLCYVGQPEKTEKSDDKGHSSAKDSSKTEQDGSQALDSPPEVLKEVNAKYPKLAMKNRWQGKVVVYGLVDKDGRVIRCKIAQSSGYQVLDAEGANAIMKFRLKPGIQNGKPVKCWISKPFSFVID